MHSTVSKAGDTGESAEPAQAKTTPVTRVALKQSPVWSQAFPMQFRLKVNRPGDKYEQEADRVADQVMRMPEPAIQRKTCACGKPAGPDGICEDCKQERLNVQRKASGEGARMTAPPIIHQALQQPGRPLDSTTRNFMEARFGQDFDGVRVHADRQAAASAQAINALAYTAGNNIFFNHGHFTPGTGQGKRLLAHELTHVVQQQGMMQYIQRAPLDTLDFDMSTIGLHEQLAGDFAAATGVQAQPGMQYSREYEDWLKSEANRIKFQPPTVTRQNPLDRLSNGHIQSHTFLIINGTKFLPGGSIGSLSEQYKKAITPPSVTSKVEDSGVSCRFGSDFQIQSSAEIVVNTAPGAQGWQKTLSPNDVLQPADQPRCAGKASVPVTLHGNPTDAAYARIVEDGEREHVRALELLHDKHFLPYYHFMRSLQATGVNESDCAANLRQQVGKRDEQAALGFIFGDLAETRRFDDPTLGTHHARITPTIDANCNAITLTAGQTRPQQPGLGPGNVRTIAPVSTRVDPSKLTVNGNDLNEGNTTLRSFNSPANANLALQLFQHYGITELLRLGSFEFLLANGSAPSGTLPGLNERNINPDYYQVTFGVPDPADWSIVEVVADQVNLIHDFNANRDQAYSAVALMQRHGFNREVWLGAANNPELKFFRKD